MYFFHDLAEKIPKKLNFYDFLKISKIPKYSVHKSKIIDFLITTHFIQYFKIGKHIRPFDNETLKTYIRKIILTQKLF